MPDELEERPRGGPDAPILLVTKLHPPFVPAQTVVLVAELHRRAYLWHSEYGTADEAIHHAVCAGAFAEAGQLIAEAWVHYANAGRTRSGLDWLALFADELRSDSRLLLATAWVSALRGREDDVGHSAGGAFTQLLLDRGHGAAGAAINSAPTEGVKVVPLSQVKATFPVLKNPANRHRAVGFTHEQWHYAFTNTFSEEESRALYERYHTPASGSIFWGSALANIHPGKDDTWVDYSQRRPRAAAVRLRQRGQPHAAEDPALKRQALQVRRDGHRGQAVRGLRASAARPGGLGADRRRRAGVGAGARADVEPGLTSCCVA